nr:MAG TPA: hypothetical protein [Caudoviricetes sp.]
MRSGLIISRSRVALKNCTIGVRNHPIIIGGNRVLCGHTTLNNNGDRARSRLWRDMSTAAAKADWVGGRETVI